VVTKVQYVQWCFTFDNLVDALVGDIESASSDKKNGFSPVLFLSPQRIIQMAG
jgi:hypothetical protein